MKTLKASYIAELSGGELCGGDAEISAIVRDNREISGGELFVAISGEHFDGHDFAASAEENGAAALLVSRYVDGVKIPQIIVPDTVSALGKIAGGYLETLSARRVCVTGSVGKTTTKEMCAAVLSESFKTHKTAGNFNNNIGLPLTVFGMDDETEAAVLELGTNHFGEILPLTMIAKPHAAVITVIGESHLEAFGSKEGVLREKTEILKGLSDDGYAILNGDDPYLWGIRESLSHKALWFGLENDKCDIFAEIIENSAMHSHFSVRGFKCEFELACGGVHNIRDALAAVACGKVFGMDDESIARGLLRFRNTGMRQDVFEFEGRTIIRDCYNANPDSMRASISLLSGFETKGKKICVLGDMLELGENAHELHRRIGEFAAEIADAVLVTGDFSDDYKSGAGDSAAAFCDKKALADHLASYAEKGDVILVKGSYGTKMWQVIEYLMGERK
ncbi:MAG: UDP-N-acetylmuramoyl-tripeptide--D-alanyl-D-alanine ligase [Oscillospiraceae bacterium]|nr:UDP-N-acetylmuramoyl-tripeptide--D-alanyl-D-alanine ligase [Oscillospiraceae bacterium]